VPRKKSVKKAADGFSQEIARVREFIKSVSFSSSPETFQSWAHDFVLIRLYRSFQVLVLEALVGAINNDTATISNRLGVTFPKHLTDEVCEYLITAGTYFDFKGYSGLCQTIKDFVPKDHYLATTIPHHRDAIEMLSGLRNFAAHDSPQAKRAALAATNLKRMSDPGSWLKRQNRLEGKLLARLDQLAQEIRAAAPY
jgi:hypothetical protein